MIGIAGRIGSGKTTAARYLASKHNFKYLRYSQVLREQFKGAGSRERLRALGWDVMSRGRQEELNRALLKRVMGHGDCVVEGLRHPIDYETLRKHFRQRFFLVYIEAAVNLRKRRLRQAGRAPSTMEFQIADEHPVEGNVLLLKLKADRMIRNDGSLKQFHHRLDRAVNRARKGSPA